MPTIADYRNKFPSLRELDDAALIDRVAEVQGVAREDVIAHMGYKPKSRGILSVLNDTVIEGANAFASGAAGIGNFVAPGNPVSQFIDENIIKAGEAKQSDVVKAEKAGYRAEMDAAEGIGDEIGATLGYVARNPLQSLAQAAGSFVLPGAAVKGGGMLASMAGAGAKGVSRAGLAGGAVAGAALSGGDAAGTAYELVKKAGGTDEEATEAARKASVLPAAIGAAGGVIGAERLLAGAGGFKGGALSRALKTAGVEAGQEAIEEGVTQYEGQAAAAPFDPSIDPMKGVAGAATMGAVLGGATGGAVSLLSGKPDEPKPDPVLKVLAAPDVDTAIKAMAEGLTGAKKPAPAELPQMDAEDRREVLGLMQVVNRPGVSPNVARFAQARMDALLAPYRSIPTGEATEMLPVADARELTDEERAEYANAAPFSYRRAMARGLPQPEVTEVLPTGDATEVEPIPAGDAFEEIPAPEAYETLPTGEVSDLIPTADATEFEAVPAGEAAELDVETIRPTDLMAKDGEPFTSKTGAQAKAYASGGGKVVAIPNHFGSGIPGYVVRPLMQARPNNTRGTDARDLPRSSNDDQRDLAGSAEQVPGASDGRGADAARSGGAVGLVPAAPGRVDQPAEAPSTGNRPADVVAGAGDADTALTPGSRVTLNGTPYTVTTVNGSAVKLQGADGAVKMVARNSKTFGQIQPEVAPAPAEGPGSDAGNGFKQGPKAGERYRVGVVASVGGAVSLEKRLPAGTAATFYIGKDGNLIDGDSVNLIGDGKDRLWIPATPEQAQQAQTILDEMGRLELNDPARKDAKARLKNLVQGKPTQEPNEAARPQAQAAAGESAAPAAAPAPAAPAVVPRAGGATDEAGRLTAPVRTFASSGYQLTMQQALEKVKELEADARQRKTAAAKAPTAIMRGIEEDAASRAATLARKLREDIKRTVSSYPDARAEYAQARGEAPTASGAVEADGVDDSTDPFTLDKRTLNARIDRLVSAGEAADSISGFMELRKRYMKATGKPSIPPAGSRFVAMYPDGAAVEADGVKPRKTLQEARADAALDKQVRENGEVLTRRQWVERKVAEGLKTKVTQEDRIKPMSRMAYFRANNEEQRAHDRRVKEAGKKDVFWIGDYEVTKTEHDYANALASPPNAEAPVQAAPRGAEAAPVAPAPEAAKYRVAAMVVGGKRDGQIIAKPEARIHAQLGLKADDYPGMQEFDLGFVDAAGKFYTRTALGMDASQYNAAVARGESPEPDEAQATYSPAALRAKQKREAPPAPERTPKAQAVKEALAAKKGAQPAPVATHKDPGEPAEPVTPAVVREAIKTGVQATDRKPSAMKADLLQQIDDAVKEAPDYPDFEALVKQRGDKEAREFFTMRAGVGEKAAPEGYSRPKRTFRVEGDGVFTVNNTVRQLLTFRASVESSPGFKDRQAPAGLTEKATTALDRRSTDAAIANMVDEGDFQAALDYAEAKGVDIGAVKLTKLLRDRLEKWQKDQASAKAVADYEAARAEGKPAPGSLAAAFAEKEAEAAPAPAAEPEADDIPEAGIASQTFDQWVRAKYASNEYKARYLEEFGGDERRAILGAAIGTIDNDRKTPDLLKEARAKYHGELLALPRETTISLEVWDALGPLQYEAQRHFYDLDTRITRRTQDETSARVKAEREKKAPYEAAFAEVDAEIRRLDKIPGPMTQKQKDLSARRERLREALYQIGQGKEPDGRLLRKEAEPAPAPAPAAPAALSGPRRDPTLVSMFNPYINGDIVTIGGKDWMLKQDMPGWYLTSDGTWRGEHPTIKGIKAMMDLIREVEQAAQESAPAPTPAAQAPAGRDEQPPAEQAAAILNAAAEPPKGKERLDVLKDVKAGAITPEEVAAAYPAATTGTESLNKRHAIAKKQVMTPGGALKADATNSRADSAVWYYQGDMDALRFTASVKVNGEADPRADDAKRMLVQIKAAQDAGWRRANYRAGSLGTVWVLQRGDEFLTRAGMENAAAVEVQRPVMPDDGPGWEKMVARQRVLARAFNDWLLTLPEDQQYNRGVVSRKIGETPVGQWAGIGDDPKLGLTLRYFPGPGEKEAREVGWTIQTQSRPDWPALRDYIAEMAAEAPADSAPAAKPAAAEAPAQTAAPASAFDAFKATMQAVYDGTATVEDYQAGYARVRDETAMKAELGKMTKDELTRMFGIMRDGKKDELVALAYASMLRNFALGKSYGPSGGYMMTRNGLADYEAKKLAALDELVAGQTADDLAAFAAEQKRISDERAGKRAALVEAVKDPKTLDDFRNHERLKLSEGMSAEQARLSLTPEQRALRDELAAEVTRGRRKQSTDEQRTTVRAAGQTTAGEIIATKHTRDGHNLWVVKLSDRVSKDDYVTLLAGAKRLGGNYSSFRGNGAVPGFQFRTPDAAQAFLKLAGGDTAQATEVAQERRNAFEDDRSQSAAERLTEMADRLEERADESLGRERKANTDRRARFAASAEAAANADKAMAKTMRNIANAIGQGGAKFLDRVRQKVQVELLQTYVANGRDALLRAKYPTYAEQERHKGEAPTIEAADYAEFPTFTAYRSDLASLGRQLLEVDGTKKLGERIMKVADDVSDAFTAFAKEPGNLFKLSTFSVRAGDEVRTAIFPTREGAERAITRSGLSGKAIVFPEKRGVNRIIMSPSEAMARGIWKGDGDKRITLTEEFGNELVEKIGRVARRGAKVSVPWQFERTYDRRKQLSRMGIETPAEFRAALREFIAMREQPAEADKIKAMERAMVGRRNDGLDFFPTPESVADEMVAAADIQPGMRVLEPSAGMGHIAERIRATEVEPDVAEFSNDRKELLEAKGFNVVARDFMDLTEGGYDRILMNPPFSDGRDIQHVRHAYDLLKPGGRVVAIMGESAFFNQNKRATEFREWLDSVGGTSEKLPEGTFNDPSLPVQTGANARMVVIEKPAGEQAGDGAAQFSRAPGVAKDVANAWRILSENDEVFTYAKSDSTDFAEIANDTDAIFAEPEPGRVGADVERAWRIYPAPGGQPDKSKRGHVIHYKDGKVELNVEKFTEGSAGSAAYAAVGNYAFNNGLQFAPDRFGMTQAAIERRLESLISLALKFGSTDFIRLSPAQLKAFKMKWRDGDTAFNTEQMLMASYNALAATFPEIKGYTYDLETGARKSDVGAVGRDEPGTEGIVARARAAGARAGKRTVARAIFTNTFASEPAGKARRELLGRLSDGDARLLGDNALAKSLYSRAQPGRNGVPIADAEAVADAIRSAYPTGPQIVVLDDVRKAPEQLLDQIRSVQAANTVEGAYYKGKIYLFPQNVSDIARLMFVGAHHEIRHAGLDALFGKRKGALLLSIAMSNPKVAEAARAKMADGLADSMVAATEEALADMPLEDMAKLNGWNKIVAAVRQWLRGMADKLRRNHPKLAAMIEPDQWTDNDVAALIRRAEDISRGGTVPARPGGAVFSQQGQRQGTEEEARAAGFTMKAYRGVSKASPFNDTGTTWMTTSREVAEAYAEEVMGYDDPGVLEVMVNPDSLPRHDASRLTDEQREAMGADEFGNPQAVGIYDRSDDHPLGGSRRNVTVIHAPREAVWIVSDAPAFSRADQTQTPAFRRWFGNSRVVGADGKPLVVYHGTKEDFSAFDNRALGMSSQHKSAKLGTFFSADPAVSAGFAGEKWEGWPLKRGFVSGAQIMPVYLSIKNPLVMEAKEFLDRFVRGWEFADTFRDKAIAGGHDGIRITGDPAMAERMGGEEYGADAWVAFRPEQIKSAIGNNGDFNPGSSDIRFSRAGTAKTTAQDLLNSNGGVFGRAGDTRQDRVRAVVDGSRPFWLGALTRDQIADMYGDELPPVRDYDNLTRAMENERQGAAQKADELYEEWSKIDAEANDRLARVMLDATVAQVHPDRDTLPATATEEQKQAHGRLRVQFKLLPKDAQAMYGKVRDFHANTLKDLRAALEGRIERLIDNGSERAVALADIRARFDKYMQGGPYFPLHRFGDFLVVAERAKDGERVVAAYENAGEQQAAARALEADGFAVKLRMAKVYARSTDGSAGKFIGDVLAAIDKMDMREASINGSATTMKAQLLDDLNQLFIKALPDLSYRKHFTHRKGTAGFSADVMRGFASSAFHAAGHIARLNHGDKMTFALEDAYQQIKLAPEGNFTKVDQVLNEMTLRHESALNPNVSPLSALATQVGFVMYLGLSPAAGLINMMQVPMVALPYIGARYGFAKATAAMGRAYTDIMGAKPNAKNGFNAAQSPKLSADERRAISTLQDEGVIDLTQAHDLAAATTRDVGNQARNKASFAIARAMRIVGWTFHVPEVMNRQVTALMAYRLEMAKSGNEGKAMDAAREAIKRSQFDYSSSNRARFMQGDIARVVTQFRQFSQNMTYFLGRAAYQALKGEDPEVRRIARQQLVATFLVTGAMAGSLGLPGLGFFAGLVQALVNAMGDDDDEPWDWKVAYRNALADNFGKEWGEVMARGVPRALMPAWDISNRVSLSDLWWRDSSRDSDSPREAYASDLGNILGPTAGTLLGWYTASDHMARGDYAKAVESVVPKFIRDPLKAWRESQDGVTSYNGEQLLELTGAEVAGRFLGFAPSRASEMYEGRNAVMGIKTALEDRRERLIAKMAKARIDGDTEVVAEMQQRIRDWNTENPKMAITGATIVRSVLNRRRNTANTEKGITLPDSKDFLRDRARFAEVD